LYGLPLFAWNQVRSLLRLSSARRDFLVTEKRRAMRLHEIGDQTSENTQTKLAEQEGQPQHSAGTAPAEQAGPQALSSGNEKKNSA
jgi:hypothetical protein